MTDVVEQTRAATVLGVRRGLHDTSGAVARAPRTDRTRVCLYTPSADPSGMGQHMLDLAREHAEAGVEVTFMCGPHEPARRLLERARLVGAHAVPLPHPRDPAFAPAIVEHLGAAPVDVFHAHVGFGREDFDGCRAARAAGVPAVVQTLHLPWLLHGRSKLRPFHRSIRGLDRLITVSDGQRATYERIGVDPALMTTVPNGVSHRSRVLDRDAARARLGLRRGQPVVMTVGRLAVMKGHRYLVEALPELVQQHPGLAVVVIGDGHLRDALEKQAAELGVSDTLRLVGHVPDARAVLGAADVFVLPSRTEGMPLAALEAMEARLPVVGTRVIGTEEVVRDGETGLLVPPRRPEPLATALGTLLADPSLRTRMGAAGRQRYLEHHTAEVMATRTRAVYADVLASAGATVPASVRATGARR